jgi:hypothetical protein
MLYSNNDDHKIEREIMDSIKTVFSPFSGLTFVQNTDQTAIFDFHGDRDGVQVVLADIKSRDIWANAYQNYFISEEKVECAKHASVDCYMVYYFEKEKLVRVFNINRLLFEDLIGNRDLDFTHRRAGIEMKKVVNTVPARAFDAEFYLV